MVQPGLGPRTRGQRCARSVLAPLLDEFVAVQTSGAEAAEAADAAIAAGARPQHDRRHRTRRRAARRQELSGDVLRQVTRAARAGAKPTANTSTPPAAPAGSDFSHREIAAAAALPYPGQRAFRSSAHVDAGPLGGYRDLFTGRGIATRAPLARRLTRTVTWITPPIRAFSALLSSSRTTS